MPQFVDYVKESGLASLAAKFGSSEHPPPDSDKLLQLYWKRAELKKEFAGMRKEQFRLQDKIKQQEGATARLQQRLDHLEDLLTDRQWVHNVVVFYQLRGLASSCEVKLAKFAEQLKQQREHRQHNHLLVKWNDERSAEARAHEQAIVLKRDVILRLEDQLQAERHRLMNMSGFLKIFRRRTVTSILDDLAEQIDVVREEEHTLAHELEEIRNRKPPDAAGLDIPTKRSINLMILSFAQQLYLHFADDGLATIARESMEKSVGAINYGDRHECGELLDRIDARVQKMERSADFAEVLQKRAQFLAKIAKFPQESDAVPIASSVGVLFNIDGNGLVKESEVHILGENFWGITKILSR